MELAGKLGVRRVPDLRLIDGDGVPMVWWVGRRPIIALPAGLIGELDDQQTSMVLAHELAHLRRRDHWVRGAELVISVLYWWNPMVGWVRRQLHEAEDLCCDAWVEWAFPDRKKDYAEVLFKAATLAGPTRRRAPALASSFLNRGGLKGRIEAVLEGGRPRQVSPGAALAPGGSRPSSCCRPSCRRSRRPTRSSRRITVPRQDRRCEAPGAGGGERSRARSPSRERMSQ